MRTKQYREIFKIKDLDLVACIYHDTKKNIIQNLKWFIDDLKDIDRKLDRNYPVDLTSLNDISYDILYKDGREESICGDYDYHKIDYNAICCIIENNPNECLVYGNYTINEHGIIYPSKTINIDDNIEIIGVE